MITPPFIEFRRFRSAVCKHAVRHQARAPLAAAQPAAGIPQKAQDPLRSTSAVKAGQRLYALGLSSLEKQRASASAYLQVHAGALSGDTHCKRALTCLLSVKSTREGEGGLSAAPRRMNWRRAHDVRPATLQRIGLTAAHHPT